MLRLVHPQQRGFTLIEVLVAITILLVGVLGVVAMVDGASAVTARTKAREGATNVSRSIVEVGRAVPYKSLTAAELLDALASRPGLADSLPGVGHTISSRGFFYDVELEVCSLDDPKDGLGADDDAIEFCANSDHAAGAVTDRNPDDYKRIAVTLDWKRGSGTETTKQTSLISNPVGGLGPSVIDLDAPAHAGSPITITNPATLSILFNATTSTDAAQLNWSVNGDVQGKADQVGTSKRDWTFTWDLESPGHVRDCTYVVQADAYDDSGRTGASKALTVVLNRDVPAAPDPVVGGRNGNGDRVDIEWQRNLECDVLGYYVYRGPSAIGPWTKVDCLGQTPGSYHVPTSEPPSCLDEGAPASSLFYYVVAVDSLPSGGEREGTASAALPIVEGNNAPAAPVNVSACIGGTVATPPCNEPDGSAADDTVTVIRWEEPTDPDGDTIAFYRIYRDGGSYADRVGVFYPEPGSGLAWTDPESPDGSAHTYSVTAVDGNFAESPLSNPPVSP